MNRNFSDSVMNNPRRPRVAISVASVAVVAALVAAAAHRTTTRAAMDAPPAPAAAKVTVAALEQKLLADTDEIT
jgi:hypothetical protein